MIPPVAKVPSYIQLPCAENSVSGDVDASLLFPLPRTATDIFRTALAPHLEMDGSLKSSSPLTG
ncbi:MAG: hypothetical protein KDK48_04245, partial [Chlamydiia bacterium]|nr:hypothetical protein [Chlamydiia bacterium]